MNHLLGFSPPSTNTLPPNIRINLDFHWQSPRRLCLPHIFVSCKGHIDSENALSTERAEAHSELMLCSKVLSTGVYFTRVSKLLLAETRLFPVT